MKCIFVLCSLSLVPKALLYSSRMPCKTGRTSRRTLALYQQPEYDERCVLSSISSTAQEKNTKNFEDERELSAHRVAFRLKKFCWAAWVEQLPPLVKVQTCNFVKLCSLSSPKLFCILLECHVKQGAHLVVLWHFINNLSMTRGASCLASVVQHRRRIQRTLKTREIA